MTAMILHIGPFCLGDGAPGETLYFLYPALEGTAGPVMAPNLQQAVAVLGLGGQALWCEPALAPEAAPLGLPVTDLDEDAQHALAMMALSLAATDFDAITREGLVFQFCRAWAAFAQARPQDWPEAARSVTLETARDDIRLGLVIGGPGLVLTRDTARAETEGLAALRAPTARPEIAEAFLRAHGLAAVPQVFRLSKGEKLRLVDAELAVLTAALSALSALAPRPRARAFGEVSVAGCHARVEATVT